MPELPDIAIFKNYFDSTALHREIRDIIVNDPKILNVSKKKLSTALKGQSFDHTGQVGKYLFAKIKSNGYLVFHFGMTGYLRYFKNDEEEPNFTQLKISFNNNYHLAYVSKRKLGKIYLTGSMKEFCHDRKIGPHAVSLDKKTFREKLSRKRGKIKSALTDQHLISGLGNVYADEVLFQSKIHPETRVRDLDQKQIDEIYNQMNEVVKTAIDSNADPANFPHSFLLSHRKENESCPNCNGEIKRIKINSRGTYLCPECQKL